MVSKVSQHVDEEPNDDLDDGFEENGLPFKAAAINDDNDSDEVEIPDEKEDTAPISRPITSEEVKVTTEGNEKD